MTSQSITVNQYLPTLLRDIGENPNREGLVNTPKRVGKMNDFLFSGYNKSISDVITVFRNTEKYSQIILVANIEFYSMCEHHMLPFYGKAHIAYIPKDCLIGVSKLARILEIFTRRLQIQERIGYQVVNALLNYLNPEAAACIIEAKHLCMMMRGIQKQNSIMITSELAGSFLNSVEARSELLQLIQGAKNGVS